MGMRASNSSAQRHALRRAHVAESSQHQRVPGPLGREPRQHGLASAVPRAFRASRNVPEPDAPGDESVTPRGFWDQQVSSRVYGKHSTDPVGREQVTRCYFEVKTEVRNLLQREGTAAGEVTVQAADVAAEAQAIEERRRIRELFLMIDTDGSNTLEREEVEELLCGLGKRLDKAAVDAAMADMDRDGGGNVSFSEFLDWWMKMGKDLGTHAMLNNATARRFIYDVPMFARLVEPKFISMLANMLKPKSFPKSSVIINRGEIGDAMYFIVTGTAAALLDLERESLAVGSLGPGSFFGEQAMIKEEPRNAYIRAVTDVEVLVLEKADMMKALQSFPVLIDVLFKETMEDRIATIEQREANYQPSWTARQPIDPRKVGTSSPPSSSPLHASHIYVFANHSALQRTPSPRGTHGLSNTSTPARLMQLPPTSLQLWSRPQREHPSKALLHARLVGDRWRPAQRTLHQLHG